MVWAQIGLNVLFVLPVGICANVLNDLERSLAGKVWFWHQNCYHSSHNFSFLQVTDCRRAVLCSLLAVISIEASPSKIWDAVGFLSTVGGFVVLSQFFFFFVSGFRSSKGDTPTLLL